MAQSYRTELMTLSDNKIYNLRSNSRNDIVSWTRPKTNYIKDTFSYHGMDIWNNIPLNIHYVDNLKCFKEKYVTTLDVTTLDVNMNK
jgi:hypothetical protein